MAPSSPKAIEQPEMIAQRHREPIQADDLDAMLDAEIRGWRPTQGDKLVGEVLNIETGGQNSQFASYPLLTIVNEATGELVYVHAFHNVLRSELQRHEVGVGDRIGIKYLGLAEGGDYGKYENYKVMVAPRVQLRMSADDTPTP